MAGARPRTGRLGTSILATTAIRMPTIPAAAVMACTTSRCATTAASAGRFSGPRAGSIRCSSRPGGWGAYDVDNDKAWLNRLPYADLRAMIDPNTAHLTAHVLEMHLHCETVGDHRSFDRGVRFLLAEQEADGSWFGRWGVNYLNGTGSALVTLSLLPAKPEYSRALDRGVAWLLRVQNDDGGWGETPRSYDDPSLKATGPSTPSQSAWALQGLIALRAARRKGPRGARSRYRVSDRASTFRRKLGRTRVHRNRLPGMTSTSTTICIASTTRSPRWGDTPGSTPTEPLEATARLRVLRIA